MTIHTRYRRTIAAAVAALVAPMALVAATAVSADAGRGQAQARSHDVQGRTSRSCSQAWAATRSATPSSPDLSCNGGDTVLDGMWMVRHVDQYNPPSSDDPDEDPTWPTTGSLGSGANDEREVYVRASYPDLTTTTKWKWEFQNRAYGDAQLTLYITCIKGWTEGTNSPLAPDPRPATCSPITALVDRHRLR